MPAVGRADYEIIRDTGSSLGERALQDLLTRVYVGGGFTDALVAEKAFTPGAVRERGQLFCARSEGGSLVGMVVLVRPSSPARRLAEAQEAELHLLAVDPGWRGHGLGAALVDAAITAARQEGYRGLVLWTQPTMVAAHRLYAKAGFLPSPDEDFERDGRTFSVLRLKLGEGGVESGAKSTRA